MTTRIASIVTVLVLVLVASACSSAEPNEESAATTVDEGDDTAASFPMTIENCGEEVVIEDAPEGILTIGTVAVEILHAAGASDLIVSRAGEFGATAPGEAGEAVADVEVLTDGDPGQEAILGTGADLVVSYGLFETTPEDLAAAGVDHLLIANYCGDHDGELADASALELVSADIRTYGELFGTQGTADAAADEFDSTLEDVEPVEGGGTVAGLYWFGADPSAFGDDSVVDAVFDQLGLDNVFGDVQEQFFELNIEELIAADPDTIVLFHSLSPEIDEEETMRRLLALPGAEDLQAIANDRLVSVPGVFAEPSPSALEGLQIISEGLATS
ncbi:MAG: ABC transporter substrate-binding protein [Acidimicrobiales bacterium]